MINALSGSAQDIQNAVNYAVSVGDSEVIIPEGTFNFVEVGDPWTTVQCPANIRIYGAPTERDSDGQVVDWKTTLIMPYEVPETSTPFFTISGNRYPNETPRFSDIKLVGYREIDNGSTTRYYGLKLTNCIDIRVDHCSFRNLGGVGVQANGCCGVIDHCIFLNTHGTVAPGFAESTVWYGVSANRGSNVLDWENDISNVVGKYTDYTIFVEDCYFELWRHNLATNYGMHLVVRYSTINAENDGSGCVDGHGYGFATDGVVTSRGTRAIEVYENQFLDSGQAIWIRGGGAIVFNNVLESFSYLLYLAQEADNEVPECQVHDVYSWNNTLNGATEISAWSDSNPITENVDYFKHEPTTFVYSPYPYPHPLTIEPPIATPFLSELEEGVYTIAMPTYVKIGLDTYSFKQWSDGETSPTRTVYLDADLMLTAVYELATPQPPLQNVAGPLIIIGGLAFLLLTSKRRG